MIQKPIAWKILKCEKDFVSNFFSNLSRMKMKEGTQLKMAIPRSAMERFTRKTISETQFHS